LTSRNIYRILINIAQEMIYDLVIEMGSNPSGGARSINLNFSSVTYNILSIVEKLTYLEHHVYRVRHWDTKGVATEEAAKIFIHMMNNPISIKPKIMYPETPEFVNAIARLIEAYRNGEDIEILDNFHSDRYLDPICRACKHCSNPIRDLQIRLPGFEDV